MLRRCRPGTLWLALPLVALLVAATVVWTPVGAATGGDAGHPHRGDEILTEDRGDVISLTVSVGGSGNATVEIGPRAPGNYSATVGVRDADGDGAVTLRINTFLAGHGGAFRARGSDAVTNVTEVALAGRLPAGTYELTARDAGGVSDTRRFRLADRTAPNVTVLTEFRDAGVANATTVGAMRSAIAEERLRPHPFVTLDRAFVVELSAPGLEGPLAAADGPNATARFRNLTEREGSSTG